MSIYDDVERKKLIDEYVGGEIKYPLGWHLLMLAHAKISLDPTIYSFYIKNRFCVINNVRGYFERDPGMKRQYNISASAATTIEALFLTIILFIEWKKEYDKIPERVQEQFYHD